jgi:predicted porin
LAVGRGRQAAAAAAAEAAAAAAAAAVLYGPVGIDILSYFQISERLLLHTRYLLEQFSDIYKYKQPF